MGKAATGREASDVSTGRFRRGSGGGTHGRGGWQQHGKPCRWSAHSNRNPVRGRPGRQGGGWARSVCWAAPRSGGFESHWRSGKGRHIQKWGYSSLAGATVYTDDAAAYRGMPFEHQSVRHSVGEYVDGMAHTNGIESFWSMLKRAHKGVYHKMSAKHLQRYVDEFAGRHGIRERGRWTRCNRLLPEWLERG